MGAVAERVARRWRTPVQLNLDELTAILTAAQPGRREGPDLAAARTRLGRARERRRQAVARAARAGF